MDSEESRKLFHDLKNDFAAMTALINLHKLYKNKYSAEELLNRIGLRQMVISVAYEKLYQTGKYPFIQFRNYLVELITKSSRYLSEYSSEVTVIKNIDDFALTLKKALPASQIIMELLTNSYMHAFEKPAAEKRIEISVSKTGDRVKITYSDSGRGFPKNLNPAESMSLGMQFINSLTRQLGGTAEFGGEPYGTAFNVEFNI